MALNSRRCPKGRDFILLKESKILRKIYKKAHMLVCLTYEPFWRKTSHSSLKETVPKLTLKHFEQLL